MINQLYEGAIASKLGELTSHVLGDLTNTHRIKIADMVKAMDSDPVAYACAELKAARAIQTIGEYKHEDADINKFVNDNLNSLIGNINEVFGELASSMPFGFAIMEIVWKTEKYKNKVFWKVKEFRSLKPENVTFKVKNGNVSHVRYQDGGVQKDIPLWKLLHISNGFVTKSGAKKYFGNPELQRAYPYIKLKSLIFAEMGVSARRTATGLLWGKADSNNTTTLYNEYGKPVRDSQGKDVNISHARALQRQLQNIENNSSIVTDHNVELDAINVPGGEQFWNFAKTMLDEQIMRAFSIPELVWSGGSGSLGLGTLSNVQLTMLDSSIQPVVEQVKNKMIEKVIRPLIINNFGHQESYGEFERQPFDDPQMDAQITSNLITALSMGLVSTNDTEAINELRRRIRLEPLSSEEQSIQAELEKQIQALQEQNAQLQAQMGMNQDGDQQEMQEAEEMSMANQGF